MLGSIPIKNFKAISVSTGKSSVLEALEFFRRYVQGGVDLCIEKLENGRSLSQRPHDGQELEPIKNAR